MKICFFLQRRFAFVGHSIIKSLHKKNPKIEFCAYVQIRDGFDFLKKQTDVNYTSLILDEDVFKRYKTEKLDLDFLKNLEQEYGVPNAWAFIELDRIIRYGQHVREYPHDTSKYTHKEMLLLLQITAKEIIKFLDKEKPDAIVFTVVGALSSRLLYAIAKKRGIPVHIIVLSRVNAQHTLTKDFKTLTYIEDLFKKIQKEKIDLPEQKQKAKEFLKNFRKNPEPYHFLDSPKTRAINRVQQLKFLYPINFLKSLRWILLSTFKFLFSKEKNDYSTIKPWHWLVDKIKQKIRILIGYDDLYDDIDLNKNFIFFPLQLEPEISTLLYAPFYTDQLWLAKQIAKSLPIDSLLYIKEHPTMYGKRARSFYVELKKIPNVRLIKPSVESFGLIEKSQMIITITSTVGFEAILMKKPVITFGDIFYNELPNTKKCKIISDLPNIIKDQLNNFKHDEDALIDYLTAIYKESVNVDLVQIWEVEGGGTLNKRANELEPLAKMITEKLNI